MSNNTENVLDRTASEDSGLSGMGSPAQQQTGLVEMDNIPDGHGNGEEYARYTNEVIKMAEETMMDGKRIVTNPGWHSNKPSLHQIPINMDNERAEPGFGLRKDTCCTKTAVYCGDLCGCPSRKTLKIGSIRVVSRIVMGVLLWAFAWSFAFPSCASKEGDTTTDKVAENNETLAVTRPSLQEEEECVIPGLPGTNLFGLLMVFLWGMVAETLIILIPMPCGLPPLPPLLGSLLVGIFLRNVPVINEAVKIDDVWSTNLRNMALGIILGRAGLEVDKKQMYKLRWVVPRLAFLPCIIEACSYGVFGHLILGLPWEWSFLLGFVCSAVAPACVVPSMIKFQEEGLGVKHGVPSLLIAAASIDDIVAINVFNILLTIIFGGEKGIGYDIGIAIAEIVLGIALGLIGGFFLHKVPDRRQHNVIRDRTYLLIALSFFFIFVTDGPLDLAGAGTLGTLVCSFVAAVGWQHNQAEAVAHYFKGIWFYFQPLLFGLTGATVLFSEMDGETVGKAIGCMLICLAIRLTVAGNSVSFLGWSHKEKFMTSISWIPKATVQAAIGGAALSRVHQQCGDILAAEYCDELTGDTGLFPNITLINGTNIGLTECIQRGSAEDMEKQTCENWNVYANVILQVSVLLILITAPVGVFLIGIAGPKLLKRAEEEDEETGGTTANADSTSLESHSHHSDHGIWITDKCETTSADSGHENASFDPGDTMHTRI